MPVKPALKKNDKAPKKGGQATTSDSQPAREKRAEEILEGGWSEPTTITVKPFNQLELTEKELKAEFTRVLSAKDPWAPHNITRYSFREQVFKLDPAVEQMSTHFEMEGNLLHQEDEQGRLIINMRKQAEEAARRAAEAAQMDRGGHTEGDAKLHRNQFNFSDRASQTVEAPMRDREVATQPPPSIVFGNTATQCDMFDAYTEDLERTRIARDAAAGAAKASAGKTQQEQQDEDGAEDDSRKDGRDNVDVVHSAAMQRSLKIVERLLNQNTFDEIAQDYKYWEDASDGFKEGEGTLLPLWKFWCERARRKHVTAVAWNPEYRDLFAASYGSYDFMKQSSGLICCFSLKNPSFPEYIFTCESGVTCLDFHPVHTSLLAVGCYDGTVSVYDIRKRVNKPLFHSSVKTGKHTDPVWQVKWQLDEASKDTSFYSISSDGRVTLWTMSKNELQHSDVMELRLAGLGDGGADGGEDSGLVGLAGGCSFDFHPKIEHLFIVGTEEGRIHKCSKAYNSQYLETYTGHYMAVYAVKWNKFHPRIFISASADWTVKLWDHENRKALMSFDLGNAVGDIEWAPFSSTVFAAVSNDGKVHVFDLAENKHDPLCDQKVVRKSKVTHLAFNASAPILLVGDDRGGILTLKLSPNLRRTEVQKRAAAEAARAEASGAKRPPPPKKRGAGDAAAHEDDKKEASPGDMERDKIEKLLGLTAAGKPAAAK